MPDVELLIRVRRAAEAYLRKQFLTATDESAVQRLAAIRPLEADYDAVFGEHADQARAHYAPMWEKARITAKAV